MPRETGTVIPDNGGGSPPKGGGAQAGWWSKLDPRKKRLVAFAGLGGVLAVIYLLSQRSAPADTIAADTGNTGTDPYAGTDGSQATGVPGAWDYAGAGAPYYQAPIPPQGKAGSGGKLAYQIALLRKEWETWMSRQPGPPREGHPPPKPPPKPKPPGGRHIPGGDGIGHHKPGHHGHGHGHGGPGGPGGRGHGHGHGRGHHHGHHHHPHGR
jgi:hypothetical protein